MQNKILKTINDCGSCDAKGEYSKGWDEAIGSAHEAVRCLLIDLDSLPDIDLREARQKTGMNMAQAAKKFGIPYRTWQDWESGVNLMAPYIKKWLIRELNLMEV